MFIFKGTLYQMIKHTSNPITNVDQISLNNGHAHGNMDHVFNQACDVQQKIKIKASYGVRYAVDKSSSIPLTPHPPKRRFFI